MTDDPRPDILLERAGFDPAKSILTRRQAEVLVLREQGVPQRDIAARFGTSRANISSIESTARANVKKARETVAFAEAIGSPVGIAIEPGMDIIDIPERVYAACDDAGTKVAASAPELLKQVTNQADEAIADGVVQAPFYIAVAADGTVSIRESFQAPTE